MLKKCTESPKFKRFVRRSGMPAYACAGILELVWNMASTHAPAGDIGRFSDDDIESEVGWEGAEGALISLLVEHGWLDRSERYRLVVHDWSEHCTDDVKIRLAKARTAFCDGSKPTGISAKLYSKEREDYDAWIQSSDVDSPSSPSFPVEVPESSVETPKFAMETPKSAMEAPKFATVARARAIAIANITPEGGCTSTSTPLTPHPKPVDNSETVDNSDAARTDPGEHPPENFSNGNISSTADWRLLVDDEEFHAGITRICELVEAATGSPYSETRRRWTAHAACDVYSDAVGGDPVAAMRGLREFVDALCGDRHPKGFDVSGFLDGLAKYPDRIFPPDGDLSARCQVLMAIRQYAELHKQTRTALRRLWVGIKKREGAMAG